MRTDITTFLQEHGSGLSFRYLLAWDFIVMSVSLLSMTQALLAKVNPLKKDFLAPAFYKVSMAHSISPFLLYMDAMIRIFCLPTCW